MNKRTMAMLVICCLMMILGGCASSGAAYSPTNEIHVVSREDGSGTRGAFIELFGIEQKGENGTRKDLTTKEAAIAKQTDVMMLSISSNANAIGYTSLGSLNDTVKAASINGVAATADHVKDGTYPIARPFLIATKGDPGALARDFISFILSSEGQAVVARSYIAISEDAPEYIPAASEGKIVIAGSSSVTPVMEKLKEAYLALNPNVAIEIQQSDSSAGMNGAMEGTCDIGMSSRDLKDSELTQLYPTTIALDGIAVIVNHTNPLQDLTKEQVRSIFTGESVTWKDVAGE